LDYAVEELNEYDFEKWNKFVYAHKELTIFHTIEWKRLLEKTFNFESKYFVVKNSEGEIVGISPAFKVKKFLKKIIISMPFFEYGGPFVEKGHEGIYKDIFNKYKEMVDKGEVSYVKIRSLPEDQSYPIDDIYNKQVEAHDFYLDIQNKTFDDIWTDFTKDSGVRTAVKKTLKNGVIIKKDQDFENLYNLIIKKDFKLGNPSFPKIFFENLKNKIINHNIITCYLENKPISSMISLINNNMMILHQMGSDGEYLKKASTEILFVEQIKEAINRGLDIVDFGRSKPNSHHAKFKEKFNTKQRNIYAYYYPKTISEDRYKYLWIENILKKTPWILSKTPLGNWIRKNNV